MKLLKLTIPMMILFMLSESKAQDIHYTMFDMAPIEMNPTQTGFFAGTFRVGGIYRTQWAGMSIVQSQPPLSTGSTNFSGFQTPSAFIDVPFGIQPKDKNRMMKSWAGVGVSFYLDRVANVSNLAASLSLAYHLGLGPTGNTVVSFGLKGGILEHRIKGDFVFEQDLTGAGVGDPLFASGEASKTMADFSGGIMVSHRSSSWGIEGGIALNHFTSPNYSLSNGDDRLPMTMIANVIATVDVAPRIFIKPLLFFQNTMNTSDVGGVFSAYELNVQALVGYHFNDTKDLTLYAGGGYRVSGDAIIRVGLDVKGLKFGFAYDINTQSNGLSYNVPNFNNNTGMAFEVGLSYVAKIFKVPVIKDVLFCPRF